MNDDKPNPIGKGNLRLLSICYYGLTERPAQDIGTVSFIESKFHQTDTHQSFHFHKLVGRHSPIILNKDER